ncbi:MAG: PEP-CTERM system histidine kinase PrsK [Gammaproteobacteria bacterium]|nr:PEP-CTERM system histidine kinase PrsK [Gammaproteobacteria bacterium]MBQ0838619.1 PEP-CTERM system histidine kinase PrsK [Gammaproteobacteria bacterium]
MNIGFISYLVAFSAYFGLLVLLVFSWRGRQFGALVILATACTAAWAAISAASTLPSMQFPPMLLQAFELAKDSAWCLFLFKTVNHHDTDSAALDATTLQTSNWKMLFLGGFSLAIILLFIAPLITAYTTLPLSISRDSSLLVWISIAIAGMLLVEQIFRYSEPADRWAIKYLCLGIAGIFAYDFFLYSEALLFKQVNPNLWTARGFVNSLAVPLIAISIARNPKWELGIHVSRDVVFHSITVMGAGIYLLAMASAGYFIRYYGGTWGGTVQIAFFVGSGVLLVILLFSGNIRAQIRVLLSKHFFSYRYDYREEWLKFTRTLAASDTTVPERIIRAIAGLVSSEGGILWAKQDSGAYTVLANWNMPEPGFTRGTDLESMTSFVKTNAWIIDIEEFRQNPTLYSGLTLPPWLTTMEGAWLIIPLDFNAELCGFALIRHSEIQQSLNWEDRDLLKTAGLQAASHLAQYQTGQALLQTRQFDAFNRLSAYIVHDLKNILAQQSLIVSNAEKHKHKPAFVDDVISTIENSVARMTGLMEQMRSGLRGSQPTDIDLTELLNKLVTSHSSRLPAPELEIRTPIQSVFADLEQLSTVFSHIIQNAQEATENTEQIIVRLFDHAGQVVIEVEDNGCGMDKEFIHQRLFKPFDSTKGLTGMGIGAFESREYIRSLGGNIDVESTPGKGSLFRITIPRPESDK